MVRWVKLTNTTTPEDLITNGMCVCVSIQTEGKTIANVLAQFDPGSSSSCVRPAFIGPHFTSLTGRARNPHFPHAGPECVDLVRINVIFLTGTEREVQMTILPCLGEAYDVVIGRDILGTCRIACNLRRVPGGLAVRRRSSSTIISYLGQSMQKRRGGIGSRKHGISGRAGKGPATRSWLNMQARADERKPRSRKLRFTSVQEALEKDRLRR